MSESFFELFALGNPITVADINLVVRDPMLDRIQLSRVPADHFVF